MRKVPILVLATLFGSGLCFAQGDTLDMSAAERAATFEQAGKPTRGMTQARVEATYGAPQSMQAAVGEPPISRWDYASFVVFFEYDRVIHAVTKR